MSSQDQFIQLLNQLQSRDNTIRKRAEITLNKTKEKHPNETYRGILQIGRTHNDPELRAYCFVLLKLLFNIGPEKKKHSFLTLNADLQNVFKVELLVGAEKETFEKARNYICDVISYIAIAIFMSKSSWDEMIQWLINFAVQNNRENKMGACRIMKEIAGYLVIHPLIKNNFDQLVQIILSCLNFPDSKVQLEALQVTLSFIQTGGKKERVPLQGLMEAMFGVIPFCLNDKDTVEDAEVALQLFTEIADNEPGFFIPKLDSLTEAMISLANNKSLSDGVNKLAAEFLVSFTENKRETCKKNTGFINSVLSIIFQMMLNIPDISLETWENDNDNEDLESLSLGEEYMDRLSLCLGGDVLIPLVWDNINRFQVNENWKYRLVAMKTLSMITEGCVDVLITGLNDIVNMILKSLEDPDIRVKCAAMYAIGQVSTDFGPVFQTNYHQVAIPYILKFLGDATSRRNQYYAAVSTVNFCEKSDSLYLELYLSDLVNSLVNVIKTAPLKNQDQAMTALGVVCQNSKKKITPYYDVLIPFLIDIFQRATTKEYRGLRGTTMLTMSLLANSVGKDIFIKDSATVLNLLKTAQDQIVDTDDLQEPYFFDSWANFSSCLGADFGPYLQVVLQAVLETSQKEVEFHVEEGDVIDKEVDTFTLEDDTQIIVDTSLCLEKNKALCMLSNYAITTEEAFFPYIEQVSNIFVPLLEYQYNEEIRVNAFVGIPSLILSSKAYDKKNNQDNTTKLFQFLFPKVFQAVFKPMEPETLLVGIDSLHQSIRAVAGPCLTNEQILNVFNAIKKWVQELREKRAELESQNYEDDADHTNLVREELQREDTEMSELAELMSVIVKSHNSTFIQLFTQSGMYEYVLDLLRNATANSELLFAICVFDDIVENLQEQSHELLPIILPIILQNANTKNKAVRQAIMFGLGVIVQYGGNVVLPYFEQIINILLDAINSPEARNKTYATSTENAVSALGRIVRYRSDALGNKTKEVLKIWIKNLPLQIDILEAKQVHRELCQFIESHTSLVFGDNFENVPQVLSIFSQIYASKLVKKDTNEIIKRIYNNMKNEIPQVVSATLSTLPPTSVERLSKI